MKNFFEALGNFIKGTGLTILILGIIGFVVWFSFFGWLFS